MKKQHKTISFVPQEPCIFAATVWENLCVGSFIRSATIDKACKMANIFDFIQTLPKVSRKQLKGPTFCTKYRNFFFRNLKQKLAMEGFKSQPARNNDLQLPGRCCASRTYLCSMKLPVH